jgi:hypothetical protein
MPDFLVKTRKTSAITIETVNAPSRDAAIHQVASAIEEGEEVEVMDVEAVPAGMTGPTGTTGVSGASGASGATSAR